MPRGTGRGCLKFGCFGCLGVLVLSLLVGGGIAGLGLLLGTPEERIRHPKLVQQLPPTVGAPSSPTTDRGERAFPAVPGDDRSTVTGRVALDLSMGRFEIVPGPAGEPIRVEGRYDEGSYELKQDLRRDQNGEWEYSLTFRPSVSWIRTVFHFEDSDNHITLILPRDLPFELTGRIGIGQSELRLGGLAISKVDLETGTGSHTVRFDEPLPSPMDRFELHTSVGELLVGGLGYASPRAVRIDHRIGETTVDLRGPWSADARVDTSCGIGQCTIRVPDQATVKLIDASVGIGESNQSVLRRLPRPGEGELPVLELEVRGAVGEVALVR